MLTAPWVGAVVLTIGLAGCVITVVYLLHAIRSDSTFDEHWASTPREQRALALVCRNCYQLVRYSHPSGRAAARLLHSEFHCRVGGENRVGAAPK